MRDRLIELLSEGSDKVLSIPHISYDGAVAIADHLLANGVIVPPCKVGQTVYVLGQTGHTPTVLEGEVVQFVFNNGNHHIDLCFDNSWVWDYHIEDVGKTFFLTKEEAENALKERSEQ